MTNEQLFEDFKRRAFVQYENQESPSFRHGLNIVVKPKNLDLDSLRPTEENQSRKIDITEEDKDKVEIIRSPKELNNYNLNDDLQRFLEDFWSNPQKEEQTEFSETSHKKNLALDEKQDKVDSFNLLVTNDFYLIRIKKGQVLENPLKINHYPWKNTASLVLILADEDSKSKIILNKTSQDKDSEKESMFFGQEVRVITESNSSLELVGLQNLSRGFMNFENKKSCLNKGSYMRWADFSLGSSYERKKIFSVLNGQGAESETRALLLSRDKQKFDIYTSSEHLNKETKSDIKTKGTVDDRSKALSRGLVGIGKEAFASEGYEKQDFLVLSKKGEADAVPNLEINNHDVQCSHGSTIGQLDREKIFYLMSKGFSREQAKIEIVKGYFNPFLNSLDETGDEIRDEIENALIEKQEKEVKNVQ